MGGLGPFRSGRTWPRSGDSFPEQPLLGPGLPQGTSRAGIGGRARTPPAPGGLWGLLEDSSRSWWLRFGALSSGSSGPGGICWPGQGQPLGPPPFPGAPQAYRSFWPLHPRRLGLRLARPPAGPCQGRRELAEPKAGSDPMPAWHPLPALPLASGGRGSCGSGLPEP